MWSQSMYKGPCKVKKEGKRGRVSQRDGIPEGGSEDWGKTQAAIAGFEDGRRGQKPSNAGRV